MKGFLSYLAMGLAWGVQKTGVFRTFLGGIGSWWVSSGFYDREPLPVQSRPHELLQVPTAMLQHFQHQVGGWKGRGYLLLSKGWTSTHLCHLKKTFGMGCNIKFRHQVFLLSMMPIFGSGHRSLQWLWCWRLWSKLLAPEQVWFSGDSRLFVSSIDCCLYLRFWSEISKANFVPTMRFSKLCLYKRGVLWNLYFWRLTFRIISEIKCRI